MNPTSAKSLNGFILAGDPQGNCRTPCRHAQVRFSRLEACPGKMRAAIARRLNHETLKNNNCFTICSKAKAWPSTLLPHHHPAPPPAMAPPGKLSLCSRSGHNVFGSLEHSNNIARPPINPSVEAKRTAPVQAHSLTRRRIALRFPNTAVGLAIIAQRKKASSFFRAGLTRPSTSPGCNAPVRLLSADGARLCRRPAAAQISGISASHISNPLPNSLSGPLPKSIFVLSIFHAPSMYQCAPQPPNCG